MDVWNQRDSIKTSSSSSSLRSLLWCNMLKVGSTALSLSVSSAEGSRPSRPIQHLVHSQPLDYYSSHDKVHCVPRPNWYQHFIDDVFLLVVRLSSPRNRGHWHVTCVASASTLHSIQSERWNSLYVSLKTTISSVNSSFPYVCVLCVLDIQSTKWERKLWRAKSFFGNGLIKSKGPSQNR